MSADTASRPAPPSLSEPATASSKKPLEDRAVADSDKSSGTREASSSKKKMASSEASSSQSKSVAVDEKQLNLHLQHLKQLRESSIKDMTEVQKHVAYFDTNHDGIVTPWETFSGFRRLGYNLFMSLYGTITIHLFMAWLTADKWYKPTLNIHIKNVHRCKHGSDTLAYDRKGRFHPDRFDETWRSVDPEDKGYVTFWQMLRMTENTKEAFDVFGYLAAKLEWFFLFVLASEKGVLMKERVQQQYDGTLFYRIELERKAMATRKQAEKRKGKEVKAH